MYGSIPDHKKEGERKNAQNTQLKRVTRLNRKLLTPPLALLEQGTQFADIFHMAFALLSSVSMSVVFCLALVRVAARRYILKVIPIKARVSATRPKAVVYNQAHLK
jgi:hypothetical protein